MAAAAQLLSFLRWRVIALRYAGKVSGWTRGWGGRRTTLRSQSAAIVARQGHCPGPTLDPEALQDILAIYGPRSTAVVPRSGGHPFVNLMQAQDYEATNPVLRHAFSPQVLDVAHDYFSGRFILDSIQVLHSWPTEGPLHDSQLWHKDYGDSKSLHCVSYLSEVQGSDDGPFVFVDRADTTRIRRSPFIRRISDAQFASELGSGTIRRFVGRPGESVLVDPAACYHYGSRCRRPRLAIFVTFNTDRPFVAPTEPVRQHGQRLLAAARAIRPELHEDYLRGLLRL